MNADDLIPFCASQRDLSEVAELLMTHSLFPESEAQNFLNQLVPLYRKTMEQVVGRQATARLEVAPLQVFADCLESGGPVAIHAEFGVKDRELGQHLEVCHSQNNPIYQKDFGADMPPEALRIAFRSSIEVFLTRERPLIRVAPVARKIKAHKGLNPAQSWALIQRFLDERAPAP